MARTGKSVALTRPQKMFGQDRQVLDEGFAGDIIGLNNPGVFAIGDTLYSGPKREFPQIPSFSPELFATLRNPNTGKYKQFQKGVQELLSEGAVQCLTSLDEYRAQEPILAAVGELQFEVVQARRRAPAAPRRALRPLASLRVSSPPLPCAPCVVSWLCFLHFVSVWIWTCAVED